MKATTTRQNKAVLEIGALFAKTVRGDRQEWQQARKANKILDRYCGKNTSWAQDEAILNAAERVRELLHAI